MWRQFMRSAMPLRCSDNPLLFLPNQNVYQQFRTTYILKRRWPPGLVKKDKDPSSKRLRARNYIYDLVEDTNIRRKKDLDLILTDFVEGFGNRGDRITMKQENAYHQLLLPGLAVYASPENMKRFSNLKHTEYQTKYSSPFVQKTMNILQNRDFIVLMNKDITWTVEPWHVKITFRKAGIHVPEDAILLPEESISGPNMELENKWFEVTVTINNTEKVPVKCVIHHWSTHVGDKLQPAENLAGQPRIPIFPDKVSETNSNTNPNIITTT